jgi:hypothetical protein
MCTTPLLLAFMQYPNNLIYVFLLAHTVFYDILFRILRMCDPGCICDDHSHSHVSHGLLVPFCNCSFAFRCAGPLPAIPTCKLRLLLSPIRIVADGYLNSSPQDSTPSHSVTLQDPTGCKSNIVSSTGLLHTSTGLHISQPSLPGKSSTDLMGRPCRVVLLRGVQWNAPETSMANMWRILASAWPVPFAQNMSKDRGGTFSECESGQRRYVLRT